ncbi:hypothetical protein D3C81_1733050 [compost metagenome]
MKTRYSTASLLMTGKAHEIRRMLRLLLDESPNPHMPLVEQLDQRTVLNPEGSFMRQGAFRVYPGANSRSSALSKGQSR